jgi:hypothetical protein
MQQEKTIKDKDTIIKLNDIIIIEKNKQLEIKDSTIKIKDNQLIQTTNQIVNLSKENKKLKIYEQVLYIVIPLVIVETLIIIFK